MKYRRPYDRRLRLLKRCRDRFKALNKHSDRVVDEQEMPRSKEAEKQYQGVRRLIADLEKELKRS